MGGKPNNVKSERVWDPLVRLFHWSLVAAFASAWFGKGEAWLHEGAGKLIICLIIFRTVWGIIGTGAARFETFLKGPRNTLIYIFDIVRGRPTHYVGHNPAGAAMIALMLLMLSITTASGVLMTTVKFWGNGTIEYIHGQSANLMVVFIGGHLLGILVASFQHRENLIFSMISGWKTAPSDTQPYLGGVIWNLRRIVFASLLIAGSIVLWRGTTLAFDASYWRMEKMIGATAKAAGCDVTSIATSRVSIYPVFNIEYKVDRKNISAPLTVVIDASTALQKKPILDFPELKSGCRVIASKILSNSDTTNHLVVMLPASETFRDRSILNWPTATALVSVDTSNIKAVVENTKVPKQKFVPPAKMLETPDRTVVSSATKFKSQKRVNSPKASIVKLQKRLHKKRKRKGRASKASSRHVPTAVQRSYVGSEKSLESNRGFENDDRSSGSGRGGGNSGSGRGGGDD